MRIPNRHLSIGCVAGKFAIGAPVRSGRQRLHKLVARSPQEHWAKISQEMLMWTNALEAIRASRAAISIVHVLAAIWPK